LGPALVVTTTEVAAVQAVFHCRRNGGELELSLSKFSKLNDYILIRRSS